MKTTWNFTAGNAQNASQPMQQPQAQPQQATQMQMNFAGGQIVDGYNIQQQVPQQVQHPVSVQQPVQAQTQPVQQSTSEPNMQEYYDSIQSNQIPDESQMLGATNVVQSQSQPVQQGYGYQNNSYNNSGYGYSQGYGQPAQPQYVAEPNYYPVKLLNKFTMKTKAQNVGLEFLTDGFNLTAFNKNQDGSKGRRTSFDSKLHINFWTYDAQNHQCDFVPVYCDLSKFAALAMMVQNGSIFALTETYKQQKAQADAMSQQGQRQFVPPVWDNLGGSGNSSRFTINRQQLNLPAVSTRLTLEPANQPNSWLLRVTVSEGKREMNGAIAPGKFIKSLFFKLDYVQLCEISSFVLAAVQANMTAICTRRAMEVKGA